MMISSALRLRHPDDREAITQGPASFSKAAVWTLTFVRVTVVVAARTRSK